MSEELKTINNNNMFLSTEKNNNINTLLGTETNKNTKVSWTRLCKTDKLKKLYIYADEYCNKNNLTHTHNNILKFFLKDKLNQKRLINNKDVLYNIQQEFITDIPHLILQSTGFKLKRCDKRNSTLRSLTNPKKLNNTIKIKN